MRITIVGGAGGVGASAAMNILRGPGAHDVLVVDKREELVASHVMDLVQVCALSQGHAVRTGALGDVAASDVVVITVGAPFRVNTSRHVFAAENVSIVAPVVDALPPAWPGILVVVTNPVDPLVTWIQRRSGLDRRRVLGYTLNDSLRLRCGIAAELAAHPATVDAWVVGEHGDGLVPLWDRVRVDGQATCLSAAQRAGAEAFLRTWYRRHVALDSGRSSTWASGMGVAEMISAIANDRREHWPASVVLDGEYGHNGFALSVPVMLGSGGACEIVDWPLDHDQHRALDEAASVVKATVAQLPAAVRVR